MDVPFDCSYIAAKHHHDLPQLAAASKLHRAAKFTSWQVHAAASKACACNMPLFSIEGHAPNREETPDELGDLGWTTRQEPWGELRHFERTGLNSTKPLSCSSRERRC